MAVFFPRTGRGADDLLDGLVDWNLHLTEAQSEAERSRLYDEQAQHFRAQLQNAHLPADQVVLAEEFLTNGAWLVNHQDPVVEANRFNLLADRLLQLAQKSQSSGNHRRMHRLLRQYNRLLESGTEFNVERAERLGVLDSQNKGPLDHLLVRDPERVQVLASLLVNAPDTSRKEIEHALGIYRKRSRRFRRRKFPGRKGETGREKDSR